MWRQANKSSLCGFALVCCWSFFYEQQERTLVNIFLFFELSYNKVLELTGLTCIPFFAQRIAEIAAM